MITLYMYCYRLSRSPIRDRRHYEHVRSLKVGYSRSHSRSHSPNLQRHHEHIYHSPKRVQKSPIRNTSKSAKHSSHDIPRSTSPYNSRSSRKSSHVRPKYSRSPIKNIHIHSRSSSPKDTRTSRKHSDSDSPEKHTSVSKRKKITKSPGKQHNSKVKLSESSLFAELVRDRQMRELAMKRLTQVNPKVVDQNEVVEIHDDSDNEQTKTKVGDVDSKVGDVSLCIDSSEKTNQTSVSEVETSNIKPYLSSNSDIAPKISEENLSPSISKEEFIENGIENFLEPFNQDKTPSDIEDKHLTKMELPSPHMYSDHNDVSPDSEIKCFKKSIKDLPLPPGKYFLKDNFININNSLYLINLNITKTYILLLHVQFKINIKILMKYIIIFNIKINI